MKSKKQLIQAARGARFALFPESAKGAFPAPPLKSKNQLIQAARGARFALFPERLLDPLLESGRPTQVY